MLVDAVNPRIAMKRKTRLGSLKPVRHLVARNTASAENGCLRPSVEFDWSGWTGIGRSLFRYQTAHKLFQYYQVAAAL